MSARAKTVLLLGASGTIGRATHAALLKAGHKVIAPVRTLPDAPLAGAMTGQITASALSELTRAHCFHAVISCLASRTGALGDAWAVDHDLNQIALAAATHASIPHFVLLSAICVQKPRLAFQQAKLAFEADLQAAPLTWSIVRPTAYFKSLSGQMNRLRAGKPFLLFGDGALTACKPISDDDLAAYLVRCLSEPALHNRILPVGGPGPAITPRAQGQLLFDALGQPARFREVPVGLMSAIIAILSLLGKIAPSLSAKAELARIGQYYATESMLVWDRVAQRYDAEATPECGTQTLAEHFAKLARGDVHDDRGDHAVF